MIDVVKDTESQVFYSCVRMCNSDIASGIEGVERDGDPMPLMITACMIKQAYETVVHVN